MFWLLSRNLNMGHLVTRMRSHLGGSGTKLQFRCLSWKQTCHGEILAYWHFVLEIITGWCTNLQLFDGSSGSSGLRLISVLQIKNTHNPWRGWNSSREVLLKALKQNNQSNADGGLFIRNSSGSQVLPSSSSLGSFPGVVGDAGATIFILWQLILSAARESD